MTGPDPPLADRLARARRETLALIALVEDADLNRSLNPEFSPMRWHLGHIAAFEAHWVLVRAGGRPSLRPEYDHLFDPTRNPKAGRVDLPPRAELLDFADGVRAAALAILTTAAPDHPDPLLRAAFVGEMVYEHECQHQEILTFLLQMIPPGRKCRPADLPRPAPGVEPADELIGITAGVFAMGAAGSGFAYDNERDPHPVALADYRIARFPVTEQAFARFIEAGGYRTEALWSAEGWRWARVNAVDAPRDWTRTEGGGVRIRTLFQERDPAPGVPVVGVSQFEAAAYARWLGRRLPTEAEWERAAAWDATLGRSRRFPWGDGLPTIALANADGLAWGTRPVSAAGRAPSGCAELAGQGWEWTSTPFGPYPGFAPFPYAGYSQDWFDGQHLVLRGGSWATRGPLCRSSFRNWYHPHVREIFAGFRCAGD